MSLTTATGAQLDAYATTLGLPGRAIGETDDVVRERVAAKVGSMSTVSLRPHCSYCGVSIDGSDGHSKHCNCGRGISRYSTLCTECFARSNAGAMANMGHDSD